MNLQKTALACTILLSLLAPMAAQADGDDHRNRPYEHAIVGRVAAFWPYNVRLRNGEHIELHEGTIINPRGITLRGGMNVRIWGHPDGDGDFIADRIDLIARHRNDDDR